MGAACSTDAVHDDLRIQKVDKSTQDEDKNVVVAGNISRESASTSGSQEPGLEGVKSGKASGVDCSGKVCPFKKKRDGFGISSRVSDNGEGAVCPTKHGLGEKQSWNGRRVPPQGRLDSIGENGELVSQVMVGIDSVEEPCGVEISRDRLEGYCKRGTIGHGAFYSLVSELGDTVKFFEDSEFPAALSSLCEPGDNEQEQRFKDFEWRRPNELFPDSFHLFLEDIEPNDIRQGSLGDCYFLSVLGSLAEWPKRIRKMFASDELEFHGCYGVHFCVRGEWRTVVVDDRFPCLPNGGAAFSKGNGSELWVMILEKAWAKLHGSYYRIEAGRMSDCLSSFTGAPVTYLSSDDETLWDLLLRGEKLDWIMNAGCTENAQRVSAVGLVASHAYSLLAAYELETPQGPTRLVQLRNPWGYGEWTGKWSDNSQMWTQQLREQLGGVHVSDDGTFFMPFNDFKAYFPSTTVCKYFDNFSTTSVQKKIAPGSILVFSVKVEEASQCYFTAHQDCMRFAPDPSVYKYSVVSVIVGRLGEYCAAKTEAAREVTVEVDAVPGTYYVWMRAFWEGDNPNSNEPLVKYLGFSTYTAKPTKVAEISGNRSKILFYEMYLDHARKNAVLTDFTGLGEPQCFKGSANLQEGSYIYYHNKSTSDLTEELDFVQLEGLELAPPYEGKNAKVFVPSGSEHLVILTPSTRGKRSWAAQSWTSFKRPVNKLIDAAKSSGNATHRTYEGGDIDLMVYTHVHQSGAIYHFENTTKDMTWMETWTFDFENLVIVDHSDKCIQINLHPGASKTICFERVGRYQWKLGASVADFKVCKNGSV